MSSLLIMSECPCKAGLLAYASRLPCSERYDTIRYDTRCYFNVRSKADISRSLIYRTEKTTKNCKREKLKSKNSLC